MPLLANSEDFLVAVACLVKDGYAQSFRSQRGTLSNAEVLVEPEGGGGMASILLYAFSTRVVLGV